MSFPFLLNPGTTDVENLKMVEKIREPYQKHARTISSVSDISTSGSSTEPLKRDENAEIRCVVLCDSETERNCVFDCFSKTINDGESAEIDNVQYLQHHWEQPYNECTAPMDCRYCVRQNSSGPKTFTTMNSDSGLTSIQTVPTNFADGFFRFSINKTVFRVMLLSKDRQNLLKIISYDFIFVGIRVKDIRGNYDEDIWEFEFKRLERHSKKAVAPLILMGYLRDVLQFGGAFNNLERTVEESKGKIKKIGRARLAIPRFVDFVTGNSSELFKLFIDAEQLYRHPGYVLQQCAYVNNLTHFSKIIENPNVTEKDLCYAEEKSGNNPIVIAAKLRHKDLVSSILRSNKFEGSDNAFLETLIHFRNKNGDTLLHTVALQGPELEEQKLLILRKEIQIHCNGGRVTHESDQLKLQRCLRSQLKSSAEAAIILEQSRALQGIPKTERELKAERGKVWSRLFFASLLLSLIFNAVDTGSDILIMIRYYGELVGDTISRTNITSCGMDEPGENDESYDPSVMNCGNSTEDLDRRFSEGELISIHCVSIALNPESKFGYTLFFLLVPWPFFIYEFFTSRQYTLFVNKAKEIVQEISTCSSSKSVIVSYIKAIFLCISFFSCFLFWPIAVLFIKYYNDGKYYLAKGEQKAAREKKIEASEVLWSTARVMEVSLESSFQPTIQLYIIFPMLVRTMTAQTFTFRLFTMCKNDGLNFPIIKADQTISIVTSILSLAWCFTSYHATLKRGALDKDLAALFYRAVLFLSVLFQILGRLFILVLFSYSFGPGMYFPVLIFLGAHIILMTLLHFLFSDAKMYWQKGGFLNLSFFHYMIGNGLANIYIHNWIRMDPLLIPNTKPQQHVSTLVRQFTFDMIFVVENITLLLLAVNSNVKELNENKVVISIVLLGFTFIGLILKCVYYRYLHIWAWLIMDYIITKEDGHWRCLLFSNMYFCGDLKERQLQLGFIPQPVLKFLDYLCGERYFSSTDSHCSRCTAVFSVFLAPLVLALGILALNVLLAVMILFSPIFIVFILPCVLFVKCKRITKAHVIKIKDDGETANMNLAAGVEINDHEGGDEEQMPLRPTNFQETERTNGCAVAVIKEQPSKIDEEPSSPHHSAV